MNLVETFRIALSSLARNRLRAILTTLGIIIGVAAVISLMSLGRGVEAYVAEQFEGLGVNILTINSSQPSSGINAPVDALTTQDIEQLSNPAIALSITQVTATYQVQSTVVAGTTSLGLSVNGVMPNYAEVNDWFPQGGAAFISQEDVDTSARVALLGSSTVEDLYGAADFNPTGLTILIDDRVFTVIGVMTEKEATGRSDPNATVLIPISTAQTRLDNARVAGGGYEVSQIQALVDDVDTIDVATAEIEAWFYEAHDITEPEDADFQVSNSADVLESLTQVTSLLTIFLSAVAGISLLVGGIGVMNIMLVSVSERTREIGLRKAVGAYYTDILGQFLIESILLSLAGGALGIAFGWGVIQFGGLLVADLQLGLTADVIILATGISSLIGIFFGLYPANRAAKMRPIEALRFE